MLRWIVPVWILAEIAAFVLMGQWLGVWATLGLVVVSGLAGMALLRQGGGRALRAARLAAGVLPTAGGARIGPSPLGRRDLGAALAEGGLRVVAGLLLLLPGFLSDVAALALLVPPIRRIGMRALSRRTAARAGAMGGAARYRSDRPASGSSRIDHDVPRPIVEAEWEDVAPDTRPKGSSGWTRP